MTPATPLAMYALMQVSSGKIQEKLRVPKKYTGIWRGEEVANFISIGIVSGVSTLLGHLIETYYYLLLVQHTSCNP
jgi:hypothetical protein